MIMYVGMILQAANVMTYYHYPLAPGEVNTLEMKSSYLWLIIEQLVFIGTILSNFMYLLIRSFLHNQFVLSELDMRR
jgi:hypothetical protein